MVDHLLHHTRRLRDSLRRALRAVYGCDVACGQESRKAYPSDISDEKWAFVAPYLVLVPQDAPQRTYELREVFNALRWLVRTGAP